MLSTPENDAAASSLVPLRAAIVTAIHPPGPGATSHDPQSIADRVMEVLSDWQPAAATLVATSDGQLGVPAGEYLVRVAPSGVGELAWRERPVQSLTWSPPVALEVAP